MTSLIQAHRGFSAAFPENTMLSFREAVAAGAHSIECDIWDTADGEFVIIHDQTLERTTNGSGSVKDRTWAELRELDAGSWFGQEFAGREDCRLPRLQEVLDEFNGKPVFLLLHCKLDRAFIPRLLELVNLRNMGHQVMFFGPMPFINAVRQVDSRFFTVNDGMPGFDAYASYLNNAVLYGHPGISVSAGESLPNLSAIVTAAHEVGVSVMTSFLAAGYGAGVEKMIAAGVDHILGNDAAAMVTALAAAGLEQVIPGERWPLPSPVTTGGAQFWGRLDGEWWRPVRVWTRSNGIWR